MIKLIIYLNCQHRGDLVKYWRHSLLLAAQTFQVTCEETIMDNWCCTSCIDTCFLSLILSAVKYFCTKYFPKISDNRISWVKLSEPIWKLNIETLDAADTTHAEQVKIECFYLVFKGNLVQIVLAKSCIFCIGSLHITDTVFCQLLFGQQSIPRN